MERIGRYEILSELGRGAMGVVYLARDPKIDRELAIKTIRLADQADQSEVDTLRERLFREARAAGKLSHPGIVTIYDVDEEDGVAYIAMELVEGRTLDVIIQQGRVEDLTFGADILKQTSSALDYAHGKGIVHRDIKPSNLILTPGGGVKIMDFGIARAGSSNLTQTGTVMGTPSYMSPEQVKGDSLDGRSDQFSLAVIAYEMVTGRKPFASESVTSVIFKIVSTEPDAPAAICPWVTPALDAVILKALSKGAGERFENCESFADGFAQAVSAETTAGVATGAVRAARREAEEASAATESYDPTAETQVLSASGSVPAPDAGSASLPPLGAKRGAAPTFGGLANPSESSQSKGLGRLLLVAAGVIVLLAAVFFVFTNRTARESPLEIVDAPELGQTLPITASIEPPAEALAEAPAEEPPKEPGAEAPRPVTEEQPGTIEPPDATASPAPEPEPPKPVAAAAPPPQPKAQPKAAVRKATPKAKTVSVYFRTTPPGAEIRVDSRTDLSCTSPCRIAAVPAGRHAITAKLAGHRTATRNITWGANLTEVFSVDLEDARVTVLITSTPPGADIHIDGKLIPQKTNAKVPLPEGTYQIHVSKEGSGEAEQVVLVDREQIPYIKFTLE